MKYCIHCGKELNDDAVYCTSCGKKQEKPKQEVVEQKGNDGLGFGIASICVFWFPILSIIFGIIALVKGTKTNRIATIVCASIGLFLSVVALILEIIGLIVSVSSSNPQNFYPNSAGGLVCY